jgi:hypothetical protein
MCTVPVSKANFSASIAAFVSDGQAKKQFVLQITLQSYDASRVRQRQPFQSKLPNIMGRELFSTEFLSLTK